ncbi:MAG: D-lactate ferricytochrome c oxidoreductase [Vezdaea aestivalis]|nr:MAG: D-lactate ferricytochrome c oxidoreductase [Vezdaea aestivalis]
MRVLVKAPRICLAIPLKASSRAFPCLCRTPQTTQLLRRAYSTEPPEPRPSFQGQLYESSAQRVKKFREDEDRFAQIRRQQRQGAGRNWAALFSYLSIGLFCYVCGRLAKQDPDPGSTVHVGDYKAPYHNTALKNLQAAWTDFVEIVGKENVSTQADDLSMHAGSEWSSHVTSDKDEPFLVVYPSSTEEVSEVARICHIRRIPLTPYSGGTSLEGHYAATRGGVCIDFRRMNKIVTLHKEDLDVIVQPAVGWEQLNEELEKDNLFFPPDPGPGAMIGGMVGTGCSGTNAYRYGTMKDWVLNLTVVLADGTVIKTRQRPRKSSAGYDLTRLFIGSEGTLGLVTEATLKLTVKPKTQTVAVASFPSIRHAAECVAAVVGEGIQVAAVEVLDDMQMKCINDAGMTTKHWTEAPTLFFKFAGTQNAVKEQVALVQSLARGKGSKTFEFAKNKEEASELWSARKEALWSVTAMRRGEDDHVWTTDVAVPISRLPDIIEQTKEDLGQSGLLGTIVGHAGDGNFHTILLFNDSERKTAEGVVHRMVKRAVEMEGTVTGEHGVGLIKRDYLSHELGQSTVNAMRKLKLAFDPLCILNCDKVVRIEAPTEPDKW